jgi:hypothetical protein
LVESWLRCEFSYSKLKALCISDLLNRYLAAAEGSSKLGDVAAAENYAQQGLEMDEVSIGSDNPLYKEGIERMRDIKAIT